MEYITLFGEELDLKEYYKPAKFKSDRDMIKFLKQFIVLEELPKTNYKHKLGYYKKRSHYINGKKVNKFIYNYVKDWLASIE